jgi:hypothetical protein
MQLGHNLRVASQLDDVADQLAQQPLAVRHGSSRLLARAEKRRGPVGTIAGVVGGVWMAVSALRRYPRLADQLTTRRLYEQATGVDRDRANADLALVADRLSPLVSAPDGPQGDGPRVAWWRGWQPAGLQIGGCRPLRPRSPIGYRWPKTTTPIQRHSWTAWGPMSMLGRGAAADQMRPQAQPVGTAQICRSACTAFCADDPPGEGRPQRAIGAGAGRRGHRPVRPFRRAVGRRGTSAPQARFEDVPVYGMSRRTKMLAGSVASVWVKAAMKPPVRTARPM